jgi:formiminotetrahydrofolate cyclodeaminase
VATVPLRIGRGCVEVVELSFPVEAQTTGSLLGDVRAARHLADAGVRTALDLAEQNVDLQADAAARQALQEEIARLRARASPSAH